MLAVTDIAAEAIKSLTTDAQLPDGGGLRITSPNPQQGGLELSLAERPADDDVVVGEGRSAVFVEAAVAPMLDDQVLDVQPAPSADGGQELRFALTPQT
jgi:Fe-S cluster assembly iron-binding protein IscA